jgi:antitoxin (DNA-binding transcriptional repressor) of toxin-antitoxin stability system
MIGAEWGTPPAPEVLTRLDAYTYLASVRSGHEVSRAFLVHGIPAAELHAEHRHPEQVQALEATIDQTAGRQPIDDRLGAIDGHAARIRQHLDHWREEVPVTRRSTAQRFSQGEVRR